MSISLAYQRHREVLDNGLTVVTVETPHLHGAMVTVYVATGSRHERPEVNGISHFLEHIFFRGCEAWPDSMSLNSALELHGGSFNGATTRDHGYYYTSVHPRGVSLALGLAGDMLGAPLFKEVELEREVILEEILDEVDDEGNVIDVDRLSRDQLFPGEPLSQPIAGTAESVRRITADDLRAHHREHYCGANLVVAVAGAVRHDEVVEAARSSLGRLPPGARVQTRPVRLVHPGPRLQVTPHHESQTDLRLTFPCVPETHPDFPALIVLRRVLDDGLASRLQREIVERRGLAYTVSSWLDGFEETGLFELEGTAAHAKVPRLLEALLTILRDLRRAPPTDAELERVKARHRCALEMMQDSAPELAGWFGEGELVREPVTPEERLAAVDAVTADEVLRVAREVFVPDGLVTVAVGGVEAEALELARRPEL